MIKSSFSPVPELSFLPAPYKGCTGWAKRESRITCMHMLKTNQSKITRPLSIRVHTAFWKKKISLTIFGKKEIEMWSWSVHLSTKSTRHYSFPNILSYCFYMLNFWKESLARTSSHLHNPASALSSLSRCFQLCDNRCPRSRKLLSLLQQSRGEHACSDGVYQTPRGFGIYYSNAVHWDEGEYADTWFSPTVEFNPVTWPQCNQRILKKARLYGLRKVLKMSKLNIISFTTENLIGYNGIYRLQLSGDGLLLSKQDK